MWRPSYLETMVDRLVEWGFNTILYEIEDKLRWRRHPGIAHDEAVTPEQTADFVEACHRKGIEVIPFVPSLGHAACVLAKPAYAHLRETPESCDQYDPLSSEARNFIIELYEETIEVFKPREYFHVGGDEAWRLGSSAPGAQVARRIGTGGLYLQHMQPLFSHLKTRGLRPLLWADMALSHPEILSEIPREVVMVDWDYATAAERPRTFRLWGGSRQAGTLNRLIEWGQYADVTNAQFRLHLEPFVVDEQTRRDGTFVPFYTTDALRAQDFDVITASANRCDGDTQGIADFSLHLPNCFYSARKGLDNGLGNLVTSWAVRHVHPEVCQFGTFAAVYATRHRNPFDLEALGRAFAMEFYGVPTAGFAEGVMRAARGCDLASAKSLRAVRAEWRQGRDPLPSVIEAGSRRCGGRDKLAAHLRDLRGGYTQAREAFVDLKTKATRNAHNLDFWMEGVDLQIFYAEFMQAAVDEALVSRRDCLLNQLASLRDTTGRLFSETYEPLGVAHELDARYGFHEEYLRAQGTS